MASSSTAGGYAYQHLVPVIPNNLGFVGVVGSWTLIDFGKTYHAMREREAQLAQARLNLQLVKAKVEAAARKSLHDLELKERLFELSRQVVASLRQTAASDETTRAVAEVEAESLQAELDVRLGLAELQASIGQRIQP